MIAKILGISLFWDDMIHQPVVSSNLKPSNATVKFEHQSMQVTIIIEALLPFAILFYFIFIFIFLATSISIEPTHATILYRSVAQAEAITKLLHRHACTNHRKV